MSRHLRYSFWLALISCCITGFAQAASTTSEFEPNNSIAAPQPLSAAGGVTVQGAWIGNNGTSAADLDYYSFYATQGDVVTINVDYGYDGTYSTTPVDLTLGLYDSSYSLVDQNYDASSTDAGSPSFMMFDPRIDNYVVKTTGFFTVVVCASPCVPDGTGGTVSNVDPTKTGDYYVTITGASGSTAPTPTPAPSPDSGATVESTSEPEASAMLVPVEVRPGSHDIRPVNPKSHGKIPVAILSIPGFNPLLVDTSSLTFGSTGDEHSLVKCNYPHADFNHDGVVDLVCLFDNQKANFDYTDDHGKLKGKTKGPDGFEFEASAFLKVVPDKR